MDFCRSETPNDFGLMGADIDFSIRKAEQAGQLLADAEYYLTQETAKAMISVRKDADSLPEDATSPTGTERAAIVKDWVKDIQRLVSGLEVVCRTLNSRIRSACNARRSRI